ncbi:vancomycin high temperature exclusion protein [Deinococcus radiodurans]|jgi:Uncharacterized membrane protein|uniref:SanA protein n=1 Tax=Deinococcus radiodurans (strain ATCC 13939 / DSM 20539 / JCM 16871 / CCUG 27074 / LMG 4051 / NBRC 15346 / NCIMB 9279 / VKM B-1422 / R1) TaxID=243230 RepID=Q9RXW8_DEIRA|nr:sanA protein [Deinococcus radiodurans R1 = ATCC 13939 = DSM 20539]QEM72152.1 vancomycin high temperature exclusion protein [Deinococcus radiodurans]ANC72537.1 protein SanA [Deinococcus radiodurans R1 = ATCC 13939 = DSM 20539]QIP28415.1 vancomycin high temperature exclusion protein [Deinococcus radiodurans]QIP32866.1 vancomycin high temperature exclusion protein [Deinococcus radiodurans]
MGSASLTPVKTRIRWRRWAAGGVGALLAGVLLPQIVVPLAAWGRTFDRPEDLPARHVGLVLGTSKYLASGRVNRYYLYRIDAAEAAYKAGKVRVLLLSGDNSSVSYDEPTTMKEDLLERGIPAEQLVLDYAGFRTLDSVVRAAEVFGTRQFTLISQPFHNERAIFLARTRGLDAAALNARDVTGRSGLKVQGREVLARVKAVLDVLRGKGPKFLGEPVDVPE